MSNNNMNKGGGEFSSILKLTDLDYIIPSQTCIKPVEIEKSKVPSKSKIEIESDGTYMEYTESGEKKSLEKVGITLNDCLACSGCITSAESVLISAQSVSEFLLNINSSNNNKIIVVSLSPQSRTSLATHFKVTPIVLVKKLITFFKSMGIDYLFDTSFSRDFSLLETANEFVEKYKQYKSTSKHLDTLPLLSSACPGWICYAEKTHGDYILPYISTTKSPQQIMGTLVKYYFTKNILSNKEPKDIYHVTVMPCYDKKLEASRNDFYSDIYQSKDVDCVLSTSEILELLQERKVDLLSLEEGELLQGNSNEFFNITEDGKDFIGSMGSSSGGYLDFLMRYAAKELFNVDLGNQELVYKVGRNPDFKETTLKVNDQVQLTFAQAFGFRNIQNIVRKIKTGKLDYHFIEVMACPSGCINGGGQIRDQTTSLDQMNNGTNAIQANKQLVLENENTYRNSNIIIKSPFENQYLKKIYTLWFNGYFSKDSKSNLHTQYHRIEKTISALNIKW